MPDAISTNTEELRRTFNEYVEFNRRDLEFLRKHQLRNLTIALYNEARLVAPTEYHIAAKVKSLGWQVIKKGTPEQWGKLAKKSIPIVSMRRMKKEDRIAEKARRQAAFDAIEEKEKMQAFVIKKRSAHIGFMASAYAIAARALGFSNVGKAKAVHAKGTASDDGRTTTIEATAGGIVDIDKRTGFANKAIRYVVSSMRDYIAKRQKEGRERILR